MGSFYQEALAEGEAKGEARGLVKAFSNLAREKFGPIPEEIDATLRQASPEDINRWLLAILNAKNVNDIVKN